MFFGKKLKEIRLYCAMQGQRKFAKTIGMLPSEYNRIEGGYQKPGDTLWLHNLIKKLGIDFDSEEEKELTYLWNEPFVMQKMSECGRIKHATKRIGENDHDTRPATSIECVELTDYINDYVREHNKKADEYNRKNPDS